MKLPALPRWPRVRWVDWAARLVGGFLAGICVVAIHNTWWGLPLGVLGTAAALLIVPRGLTGRSLVGVGWLAALLLALRGRPEGDYVIAANTPGSLLLGGGLVVLVATLWSAAAGPRRTAEAPGPDSQADRLPI